MTGLSRTGLGVVGAGAWGTALAVQAVRAGHPAMLWGRHSQHLDVMARERRNRRYLPEVEFPTGLGIEADLGRVVTTCRDLLICVPSHAFREILMALRPLLRADSRVAWATKGFEQRTGVLPHEVVRDVFGPGVPVAVISGPTFAREVGAGLPTALTVASPDGGFATGLAALLSSRTFRAYTSSDMVGVEVGGAVKNVLAIAAGISDGLGFGANTRVALITRGLVEMTRLGVALGARAETFMGLSGIGDLVLTCTDDQSRNRRLGLMLARGSGLDAAIRSIEHVVEGVYAADAVRTAAGRLDLEMPICEQVFRLLYEGASPHDSVAALMDRELRAESDSGPW